MVTRKKLVDRSGVVAVTLQTRSASQFLVTPKAVLVENTEDNTQVWMDRKTGEEFIISSEDRLMGSPGMPAPLGTRGKIFGLSLLQGIRYLAERL